MESGIPDTLAPSTMVLGPGTDNKNTSSAVETRDIVTAKLPAAITKAQHLDGIERLLTVGAVRTTTSPANSALTAETEIPGVPGETLLSGAQNSSVMALAASPDDLLQVGAILPGTRLADTNPTAPTNGLDTPGSLPGESLLTSSAAAAVHSSADGAADNQEQADAHARRDTERTAYLL